MKTKKSRALEILWLVTSFICLFTGVHQTINISLSKSYPFFIFTALSFLMYLLRRYLRTHEKADPKS